MGTWWELHGHKTALLRERLLIRVQSSFKTLDAMLNVFHVCILHDFLFGIASETRNKFRNRPESPCGHFSLSERFPLHHCDNPHDISQLYYGCFCSVPICRRTMSSEAPRDSSEQLRTKKRARYTQVAWYVALSHPFMKF